MSEDRTPLERAARYLYGEIGASAHLADRYEVRQDTAAKWRAGKSRPPAAILRDLAASLRARAEACQALADDLDQEAARCPPRAP